jgi:hypothetical protein
MSGSFRPVARLKLFSKWQGMPFDQPIRTQLTLTEK